MHFELGEEHRMLREAVRDFAEKEIGPLVDGLAAAYVCHGFVCDRPVTTPDALAAAVRAR